MGQAANFQYVSRIFYAFPQQSYDYAIINLTNNIDCITVAMNVFRSLGIPARISTELLDRLIQAGFVNEKLDVTPIPINYDGKRGELMW